MPATLRLTGSGVNAVGGDVETRNQSSAGPRRLGEYDPRRAIKRDEATRRRAREKTRGEEGEKVLNGAGSTVG